MKTILLTLVVIVPLRVFSQFSAPRNFEYGYEYIEMGNVGYCAGQLLDGPDYCSHFKWTNPDTSTTTRKAG
jgi:hypothetical protein